MGMGGLGLVRSWRFFGRAGEFRRIRRQYYIPAMGMLFLFSSENIHVGALKSLLFKGGRINPS